MVTDMSSSNRTFMELKWSIHFRPSEFIEF